MYPAQICENNVHLHILNTAYLITKKSSFMVGPFDTYLTFSPFSHQVQKPPSCSDK